MGILSFIVIGVSFEDVLMYYDDLCILLYVRICFCSFVLWGWDGWCVEFGYGVWDGRGEGIGEEEGWERYYTFCWLLFASS